MTPEPSTRSFVGETMRRSPGAVALLADDLLAPGEDPSAYPHDDERLQAALDAGRAAWDSAAGSREDRLALAAATLAYEITMARAFAGGNKLTAFHIAQQFLDRNGCEDALVDDDVELARHIRGYADGTHAVEDTARLFRERISSRTARA